MTNEREEAEIKKILEEDGKRWTPPICHFTPMFFDESDYDQWWECRHCGHTKEFGMLNEHINR